MAISSALVLWIVDLPCMSLMLSLLYGNAFLVVLTGRLVTKLVMFPIQIAIIFFLSKYIKELSLKYLYTETEE